MGWGRMLLMGDWGQQLDIHDQKREIQNLRRKIRRTTKRASAETAKRIETLEKENDELRLYLASLIRYLGSKGVLQKEEFSTLVEAVDAEDGAADGGYNGDIVT